MALVTALLLAALFLHFCAYLLVGPRPAGVGLVGGYGRWWQDFLGEFDGTSPEIADAPAEPTPAAPPADPLAVPGSESPLPNAAAEAQLLSYFPLNDGNVWQYRTRTARLNATPQEGQVLFRVVAVDRSGDRPKYRASVESVEFTYQVRGTDLTVTQADGQSLVPLRYPLDRGATWESPPGYIRYTVLGSGSAKTPVGEFDCLRIEKESLAGGPSGVLYYAEGVGLVKQALRTGMADETTWELIGYRVNGRTAGTLAAGLATPDATIQPQPPIPTPSASG